MTTLALVFLAATVAAPLDREAQFREFVASMHGPNVGCSYTTYSAYTICKLKPGQTEGCGTRELLAIYHCDMSPQMYRYDADRDWDVDLRDFAIWQNDWRRCDQPGSGHDVDMRDVAEATREPEVKDK